MLPNKLTAENPSFHRCQLRIISGGVTVLYLTDGHHDQATAIVVILHAIPTVTSSFCSNMIHTMVVRSTCAE